MTRGWPCSPWLLVALGALVLAVGLAGCFTQQTPSVPASTANQSDCPSRGSGSPQVVTTSQLTQNETWSPDASRSVDIELQSSGDLHLFQHTLTIEPCTIVEMGKDTGIDASGPDARLEILGEEGKEVHIRGTQETPGHWDKIRLHNVLPDGHVLERVLVEHGGQPGGIRQSDAAVEVVELGPGDRVNIENVSIQESGAAGLYLDPLDGFDQSNPPNLVLEGNTFTRNQGPGVATHAVLARHLDTPLATTAAGDAFSSNYADNDGPGVRVWPGTLTDVHDWDDLGVPYQIATPAGGGSQPIVVDGNLDLGPGTTVAFEEGEESGFLVRGQDQTPRGPGLFAGGAPENRVRITGASKISGSWNAVRVTGSGTMLDLRHTDVMFGGASPEGYADYRNGANIHLHPTGPETAAALDVTLDGVIVGLGGGDGIQVGGRPWDPDVNLRMNGVEVLANDDHPIAVRPFEIPDLDPGTTFAGNGEPGVAIIDRQLSFRSVTIPALETHYLATEGLNKTGDTLTLEPGTHIKFAKWTSFRIDSDSHANLRARGTQSDPVVLEGAQPKPGFWWGLYFATGHEDNVLEWTEIRHGGSTTWSHKTCGAQPLASGPYDPSITQGGNLVIGNACQTGQPGTAGTVTWKSGSSTQHPAGMAGIWANTCDQVVLSTSGSVQVAYDGFASGDLRPSRSSCPPATN